MPEIKSILNKNLSIGTILLIIITYIVASVHVSKRINKEDVDAINLLGIKQSCKKTSTYDEQIKCIKAIQSAQYDLVKSENCREGFIQTEPMQFINADFGCCFDRARFIEKALLFYGIKSRRISLYDISKFGYFSLLLPKTDSHAAVEAKTSLGWVGVETVKPSFLLFDDSAKPLTFRRALQNRAKSNLTENKFYESELISIIGLYSRNGKFFRPYMPYLPEINFSDFLYNFN